ncbi:MAG TPA: hypothetical protein IAB02_00520 [Candidatus Pullichristensenella excrementigallinarum]|uniref:Calcineurin-like phosphoesterase domain-containing protein n=1 Tax=Candidatus Pullichristensenella excrementigallinarum TaxID=2840907 RepID=A0A9D1IBP0_9FIRM|nr:hypothetical protein [Candidatus Pullichristensenella excrementigallinarum]
MAKKAAGKGKKRRFFAFKVISALLLAALLLAGGMHLSARVLFVRYASVALEDLPSAFDGVRVLFLSDLDVTSKREAQVTARLLETLHALAPDIVLLGGDYANPSFWDRLNGTEDAQAMAQLRQQVFQALAAFDAPLGKYAVIGDGDVLPEQLAEEFSQVGVRLLCDEALPIRKDGQTISLLGLAPDPSSGADYQVLAESFLSGDLVLAFAHSPESFVNTQTTEASDGGGWVDLFLAGHTHGGQIVLAGRTLLDLTEHERRYLSGWRKEGNTFLLTSCGVGCEGAAFRLGTRPEVHLITLYCADKE